MFSNVGNGNSLRLTIHEPGTLPIVTESGIDLHTGSTTSIGINVKNVKRLDEPYGR